MKPLTQITPAEILDFLKKVDKKTWIRFGIIAGAVILFSIFVVWPAWFKRAAAKNRIRELKTQITLAETLERRRTEILRSKDEFQKYAQELKARIYKPEEASSLLGQISKLTSENGVSIVTSQPKPYDGKFPPPFDQQYEAKVYEFFLEGKYHDLGRFIASIESNPKLLRVRSLRIAALEKSPTSHSAEVNLSAVSTKGQNS